MTATHVGVPSRIREPYPQAILGPYTGTLDSTRLPAAPCVSQQARIFNILDPVQQTDCLKIRTIRVCVTVAGLCEGRVRITTHFGAQDHRCGHMG